MSASSMKGALATAAAIFMAATPASAHYQQDRGRTGRVADEIVRQVGTAVDAIDRVNEAIDGVRYGRADRFAIDQCVARAQQFGAVRIDRVVPHGNRSRRVYGTAGATGRYDRYSRQSAGARSFTCTVRDDGRVKFKTRRLRF